jgi:hypothetical protein
VNSRNTIQLTLALPYIAPCAHEGRDNETDIIHDKPGRNPENEVRASIVFRMSVCVKYAVATA